MANVGHAVRALCCLLLGAGLASCITGPPDPPELCLAIEASPSLNAFEGEPHVVVLYFYPLQSVTAFRQTDPQALLRGGRPPGLTGEIWETTVMPGTYREFREPLPRDTRYVGILADFYSGPSRTAVEASCGVFSRSTVVLSASAVQAR